MSDTFVFVNRDALVEEHQFAKGFGRFGPIVLKNRWLTLQITTRQGMPPFERSRFDDITLPHHLGNFRVQVGRQNVRGVRIVGSIKPIVRTIAYAGLQANRPKTQQDQGSARNG